MTTTNTTGWVKVRVRAGLDRRAAFRAANVLGRDENTDRVIWDSAKRFFLVDPHVWEHGDHDKADYELVQS